MAVFALRIDPAGTSVVIAVENFTGASVVNFGPAKNTSFTVDSDTEIMDTVSTGAGARNALERQPRKHAGRFLSPSRVRVCRRGVAGPHR